MMMEDPLYYTLCDYSNLPTEPLEPGNEHIHTHNVTQTKL